MAWPPKASTSLQRTPLSACCFNCGHSTPCPTSKFLTRRDKCGPGNCEILLKLSECRYKLNADTWRSHYGCASSIFEEILHTITSGCFRINRPPSDAGAAQIRLPSQGGHAASWQNRGPEPMNDSAADDRMYLYREKPVRYRDIEAASGSEDPPGFKEAGPVSAAVLRPLPSSTSAIASIRRAALASQAFADAARNLLPSNPCTQLLIAAIATSLVPMAVSQSLADSGIHSPSQKIGRLV